MENISILTSVKKMLGLSEDYNVFDLDVIIHINSAFSVLTQLGVGPSEGYSISDASNTWDEFLPPTDPLSSKLDLVKTYVYLKTRIAFDPPTSSIVVEAMNKTISEYEWRINAIVDPGK